jgi:ArsR family transcriptional regulator
LPEAAQDLTALKLALQKRQDSAREYFNQLAGRFGRAYCPGRTWEGVAHLLFALVPPLTVADLGAGEGTISQLLAKRAKKVIAIDNSEKMVEFGAALAKKHGFKNLEFRHGDLEAPPIPAGTIDLAILSQALHHAGNPARAVAAAHRILKKGGRLAILDLLAHQFEKARELYADTWLGFTEAQLHAFLTDAGFTSIEITVVARDDKNPQFQTVLATGLKG